MIAKFSSMIGFSTLPGQRLTIQKKVRKRTKQTPNNSKQLLVDVSAIIKQDAHTGIQRVVRALLLQLFKNPPHDYRIVPVYCTRQHFYRYAEKEFVQRFDSETEMFSAGNVIVSSGDLFFGLDLTAHLLPHYEDALFRWKQQGVKIHILVYDMLPYLHPEWFTPKSVNNFRRWLRTIAVYADKLICISETVKKELRMWLKTEGFAGYTPRIATIPMGAEIEKSLPTFGIDPETTELMEPFKYQKFILMVGTIEPRKGYADVLDAMERVWEEGEEFALVIVGKPGWKTNKLQERLVKHPHAGKKLFWLNNVSDLALQKLYTMANVVLMASYGEGFGLPILEAMYYGKPLIVRDIPIFHEVAAGYSNICYFSENDFIFDCLKELGSSLQSVGSSQDERISFLNWKDSCSALKKVMCFEK